MRMRTATATFHGISPYSQGRKIQSEKHQQELDSEFEKRTWRERLNVDSSGEVFIPPMAIKNMLVSIAAYRSDKIAGVSNGKQTYTKKFKSGVLCYEPVALGIEATDVRGEWLFVGLPGKTTRVDKCFPVIPEWGGEMVIAVTDQVITNERLEEYLADAGMYIGLGRFRPENNGFYGRFEVDSVTWS